MAEQKKSRLAEELENLRRKNTNTEKSDVFCISPKDGTKKVIRQIPYIHDPDGYPFFKVYWHYKVAGNSSVLCPLKTNGDPCPICEMVDELKNIGSQEAWNMVKKIKARLRAYSPVIERGNEGAGIKLWGYGVQIYEALLEKFEDPKWGHLSDVATGRDIEIWTVPKKTKEEFDQPQFDVFPTQSKLLAKKVDIEALLKSTPNYLEDDKKAFPVKSYQELKEIVRKFSTDPVEEDETDFPPEDDSVVVQEEEKSDQGDFKSRLSNLLGD